MALAAVLLLSPAPVHAATLNATDDTFVKENNPGINFGSNKKVKVRAKAGKDQWGFAKFDISVLGSQVGDDVGKATLSLWIRKVKSAGTIEVCRVGGSWAEGTLTWTAAQSLDFFTCIEVVIEKADKNTWSLVDITDFVKGWLDSTFDNDGIAIQPVSTNIHFDWLSKMCIIRYKSNSDGVYKHDSKLRS